MDDGSRLPRRGPAKVIDWIQGLFSGVFHFFKREQEDSVTEKEIISMVDEAHEKGVLQKDEAEMIQNIFAFEDKEVGVVMTHRSSVAAFAMDDLLKDVVNHMMEEENSRYPVCGEDMDDIRGLIHYKDALKFFTQNPWAKFKPLKELPGLIRKATFVPETRHIGQLFRTMQARQVHMAVVVDEYGQTAGIVTMEDLIEEIVGDIFDEYDESRDTFRTQVDNSIIIDGLASLDDVEQELDIEFGDVEMETLNGYLTELLGHIPSRENDAKKGKVFTVIGREIVMAVNAGGADPNNNSKLRDVIAKAKANNMPNDTIERGIKKAAGADSADSYERATYEGYGPNGVAIIVETLTDNKNRTASNVRNAFTKGYGSIGTQGCVSFMFDQKGQIIIDKEELEDECGEMDADELMMTALDAGAEDFNEEEDSFEILTAPDDFSAVREALEKAGIPMVEAQVAMVPQTYVDLTDEKDVKNLQRTLDLLDEDDDVTDVWTNWNE